MTNKGPEHVQYRRTWWSVRERYKGNTFFDMMSSFGVSAVYRREEEGEGVGGIVGIVFWQQFQPRFLFQWT